MPSESTCKWHHHQASWYCLPPDQWSQRSQPPVRAYVAGGEWEKDGKDIVRRLRPLFSGSIVVTAGLYFGDWLPMLSAAVGPGGRVFGYEPVESSFLMANATMVRNRLRNVHVENACISNTSAHLSMCTVGKRGHPRAGGAAIYASMDAGEHGRMRAKQCGATAMVRCHMLDNVLTWRDQRVSLLHLDVEGHEPEVMLGARALVREHRPVIASEGMLLHARSRKRSDPPPRRGNLAWLHELGYKQVCYCDNLHWYSVQDWTHGQCIRLPPCCKSCIRAVSRRAM